MEFGGRTFTNRGTTENPIYDLSGDGGSGDNSNLFGYFKTRAIEPHNIEGGTTWATYAVGMEVDPNKTYKLINVVLLNNDPLSSVYIGSTIPTVESGFTPNHHPPVAAGMYAFIKNNATGLVYDEGTILMGTTQNPSQRTTSQVSNKSIMYFLLDHGSEADIIAHLEVS